MKASLKQIIESVVPEEARIFYYFIPELEKVFRDELVKEMEEIDLSLKKYKVLKKQTLKKILIDIVKGDSDASK